jgi:hypothetical protein
MATSRDQVLWIAQVAANDVNEGSIALGRPNRREMAD